MAKALETWTVFPHGPLEELAPNLRRIEGSIPGSPLKRVMTVVRRTDGTLLFHNGIALPDALMAELEAWGKPGVLVVPNGYHRLDAKIYLQRYPSLKVVCPPAARKAVSEVVPVHATYDEFVPDETVSLESIVGVKRSEGLMRVRSPDGVTLVFNDLIFNMPHGPGLSGFVLRHVTKSSGGPCISRVARLLVVDDAAKTRASLETLARTPGLKRIIVSHHEMISERASEVLAEVAKQL